MIVQNLSREGRADLTFTTQKSDIERAITLLEDIKEKVGFSDILIDRSIVKISVIGVGMRSNLEIASVLFKTLAEKGINIQLISTSEIKISVIIPHQHTPLAMCALHTAYNLDFDSH
jgi:aspartate kinase